MTTWACIGTGPSLTLDQIQVARERGWVLSGCNNAFQIVPDLRVLYACNFQWWREYWDEVRFHPCEKYTQSIDAATKYHVHRVNQRMGYGLSRTPNLIHHGHGSGFSLVNLAYLLGASRIVLLGYDLRYASDYDGATRRAGSRPRHYFGEYPEQLQHWPKKQVVEGVHVELLELYRQVAKQALVPIINATPGSALDCFPTMGVSDVPDIRT